MISPTGYFSTAAAAIDGMGGTTPYSNSPFYYSGSNYNNSNVEHFPNRIFVGGFSHSSSEMDLRNFFKKYGKILDVKLIRTLEGVSKGYGFVDFNTEEEANSIISKDLVYQGKRLNIGPAVRRFNSRLVNNRWPNMSPAVSYAYAAAYAPTAAPGYAQTGPQAYAPAGAPAYPALSQYYMVPSANNMNSFYYY